MKHDLLMIVVAIFAFIGVCSTLLAMRILIWGF